VGLTQVGSSDGTAVSLSPIVEKNGGFSILGAARTGDRHLAIDQVGARTHHTDREPATLPARNMSIYQTS
jgi:hypothetical protein